VLGVGAAGGMSVAEVVARAGATSGPPSAIGKNLMRGNAPASSTAVSGLSAAWFADGDAMEDGSDLDESVRRRLDQARSRRRASSGTGAIASAEYARESRRRWKLAAVVGVVAVLVAAGALALSGGDDEDGAEKTPAASAAGKADKPNELAAASPLAPAPSAVPTPAPETAAPSPPTPEPAVAAPAPVEEPPAAEATKPAAKTEPVKKTTSVKSRASASKTPGTTKTAKTAKSSKKPGRFDAIGAEPIDPYAGGEPTGDAPDPEPKSEPSGKPDAGKADFYAKLGDRDLASGDFLGAATNFNKARELDGNNLTAIIGLGEIALSQGSTSAAIAHLKKATKLKSSSARAHTLLGEAYLSAGQKSNAAASFKKALKIDPDNARARDGYNEATGANQPDPGALE
jgi:hypothetical protein